MYSQLYMYLRLCNTEERIMYTCTGEHVDLDIVLQFNKAIAWCTVPDYELWKTTDVVYRFPIYCYMYRISKLRITYKKGMPSKLKFSWNVVFQILFALHFPINKNTNIIDLSLITYSFSPHCDEENEIKNTSLTWVLTHPLPKRNDFYSSEKSLSNF